MTKHKRVLAIKQVLYTICEMVSVIICISYNEFSYVYYVGELIVYQSITLFLNFKL